MDLPSIDMLYNAGVVSMGMGGESSHKLEELQYGRYITVFYKYQVSLDTSVPFYQFINCK